MCYLTEEERERQEYMHTREMADAAEDVTIVEHVVVWMILLGGPIGLMIGVWV